MYSKCITEDSSGHPWCSSTDQFSYDTFGYCFCPYNGKNITFKLVVLKQSLKLLAKKQDNVMINVLDYSLVCTSCYDCKWHGGKGQKSLGGNGHTLQECLDGCKNLDYCKFASLSESGYCHLFDNCDEKDYDLSKTWIKFKKIGKVM